VLLHGQMLNKVSGLKILSREGHCYHVQYTAYVMVVFMLLIC
jgi:hypothetical protein